MGNGRLAMDLERDLHEVTSSPVGGDKTYLKVLNLLESMNVKMFHKFKAL